MRLRAADPSRRASFVAIALATLLMAACSPSGPAAPAAPADPVLAEFWRGVERRAAMLATARVRSWGLAWARGKETPHCVSAIETRLRRPLEKTLQRFVPLPPSAPWKLPEGDAFPEAEYAAAQTAPPALFLHDGEQSVQAGRDSLGNGYASTRPGLTIAQHRPACCAALMCMGRWLGELKESLQYHGSAPVAEGRTVLWFSLDNMTGKGAGILRIVVDPTLGHLPVRLKYTGVRDRERVPALVREAPEPAAEETLYSDDEILGARELRGVHLATRVRILDHYGGRTEEWITHDLDYGGGSLQEFTVASLAMDLGARNVEVKEATGGPGSEAGGFRRWLGGGGRGPTVLGWTGIAALVLGAVAGGRALWRQRRQG